MSKIRLIEGYHDRKNIQYYRDYEVKTRAFLDNENLSDIQLLSPYFLNSSDKFNYDYYSATWYDKDNNDYDVIYFCIHREKYIVYTDKNIYEFERGDTVEVYLNGKHGEFYIENVFIGLEISVCFGDDFETITEIEIIE
jgi:hypothetical protein